jgi:hypothetical protein
MHSKGIAKFQLEHIVSFDYLALKSSHYGLTPLENIIKVS